MEQQIANRIQEYIPDLKKQVRMQIAKQLSQTNRQMLEEKTVEIREMYMERLRLKAEQIKENVSVNLGELQKEVGEIKREISQIKSYQLSETQKIELLESTVNEIMSDDQMLQEIKRKLHPKVEEKLMIRLQSRLQDELDEFQAQKQAELAQKHREWQADREKYWEAESERQLEVLAEQHKQLKSKQGLIQESLASKRSEREMLQRQIKNLQQKNKQISYLKTQIKLIS